MRLVTFVGLDDDDSIVVAGCVEERLWEIVDDETFGEWRKRSTQDYPDIYRWRDVIVNVPDDALAAVFATTEINADVQP